MTVKNRLFWVSMLLLSSCFAKKKLLIYSAECNEQKLTLSIQEKKEFSTIRRMEIKVGSLKEITVFPGDVSRYSPYSNTVLQRHTHHLFDTFPNPLRPGDYPPNRMMLIINPEEYSKTEYEQIYTCLSANSRQMEQALYEKYAADLHFFYYPRFTGIIYARPDEVDDSPMR